MSKFYKYLNENIIEMSKYEDQIIEECYTFLKMVKKDGYNFLYSGRRSNEIIEKKEIRKNRIPSDTPKEIHNIVDELFYKSHGVKARSQSLFTYPNDAFVGYYGKPYYVFPAGKNYKLVWNDDVGDLFGYLNDYFKEIYTDRSTPFSVWWKEVKEDPKYFEEIKNELRDIIGGVIDEYKISRSTKRIPEYNEVMVVTDYTWLIDTEYIKKSDMKEWIDNNIR